MAKNVKERHGREVLVLLPDDRAFIDEIGRCLKIEKFLRLNTSSALPQYETIKENKSLEMRQRNANVKLFLTEAIKAADIYVNGDKAQINTKDISNRINEALGRLVSVVYHKLSYIDAAYGEDEIRKLFKMTNQNSFHLEGGTESNIHALDDVLQYIAGNSRMHLKTSMKAVKDRFVKAPYGFVDDDVHWLIAKLFKRGDLAFFINGASVTLHNKNIEEIINYIIKKNFAEKLMIEEKVHISDKEVVDIMMTLFDDEQILKAYTKDIEDNTAKETEKRTARETAERMIKKGKMPLEEIADYVPSLSFEELKKLESEIMQLV